MRALMQLVCVVLLLAAQQGALTHQVRHLPDHLSVKLQQRDDGKRAVHTALCDYHGAFAEVLGAIGSTAPALRLAANDAERDIGAAVSVSPVTSVTPAARGPPVLL
jgi:hypothetical protein